MTEIKDTCYKGTRILLGNEKRTMLNAMLDVLLRNGFTEISLPVIQFQQTFNNKVGHENQHMMFTLQDKAQRDLCLAPEYTAVIQSLAKTRFKYEKDLKVFYIQECFRGERPQAGRYRQFTQVGVEIINPTEDHQRWLIKLCHVLIAMAVGDTSRIKEFNTNESARRGLDYYNDGLGFEITCDQLGAQSQVAGGGAYDGGIGFAIGLDRLLLLAENDVNS